MKKRPRAIVQSVLAMIFLVGLDQISKIWIVNHFRLYERKEIIAGFFDLTYLENTGAGFSIFEGYGKVFFATLTIVAFVFIVYMFWNSTSRFTDWMLTIIMAGAIGNFIDRMFLGYVRDFLSFCIFGWDFPVFNIADICISVGFGLLLIYYVVEEYRENQKWKKKSLL